MRVCFVHYSFNDDGVTRSVLNNIKGLREISPDIRISMVGNSFSESLPLSHDIKKKLIDWNSPTVQTDFQDLLMDSDVVIIENPAIGIYPKITKLFKEYSEHTDKRIIYRTHDFIDDRPHLFNEFFKVFKSLDEVYPQSENVTFLTLTSFDKGRLLKKGLREVRVLPNSIITSDLIPDENKSVELRKKLEEENILSENEKIILYPVRIAKRKNIEEALLISKILSGKEDYKLIVTLPYEGDYKDEILQLAKEFKIKCSIGEAGKIIGFDKDKGFTISELFNISDIIISTSVREGFGFAFIEPWIAGSPVIGRNLPEITWDFENNGINLNHLYDDSILDSQGNPEDRMKEIRSILSDKEKLLEISEKLDLEKRRERAMEVMENNIQKIKENYDYINVARKLFSFLNVENPVQLNF